MSRTVCIKNMVCPRCIKAVREILDSLGIGYDSVTLGQAQVTTALSPELFRDLKDALMAEGFEVLDDAAAAEAERIRLAIIEWARMDGERPALSEFLRKRCLRDYSAISKLFSQMKSVTVERYAMLQRMEYAKELISYEDRPISEIAWMLGFSSPAHFSNCFRKETGISPTRFRKLHPGKRQFIDKL